tara:strand:- start:101 stop:541 length:441 start_codon:yes stop_codon:yes gene_type:complete
MNHFIIYTDGSCLKNPGGPGGWAFIVVHDDGETCVSGHHAETTNNRMELMATIQALEHARESLDGTITLYTDSSYVKNGITKWIKGWKKNGWKTAAGTPVKNHDLWEQLMELNEEISVTWEWVKAHADNKYNNMVDHLAREAAIRQ